VPAEPPQQTLCKHVHVPRMQPSQRRDPEWVNTVAASVNNSQAEQSIQSEFGLVPPFHPGRTVHRIPIALLHFLLMLSKLGLRRCRRRHHDDPSRRSLQTPLSLLLTDLIRQNAFERTGETLSDHARSLARFLPLGALQKRDGAGVYTNAHRHPCNWVDSDHE